MALRWLVIAAALGILAALPAFAQQGGGQPAAAPAAAATPAPATPAPKPQPAAPELQVTGSDGGAKLTVVAVNADAKAALDAMAKESGWEIRIDPVPQAKLTLTVNDESFERALLAVAARIGYRASRAYVIAPKKEGQELPDALRLPMGLPTVSLKLPNAVPVAQAVAALMNGTQATIEVLPAVKGEAKVDADGTPLSEVLDDLCRQVDAIWTLSYRLVPAPKAQAGGDDSDAAAEDARQEAQRWSKMTPEQRQTMARQQMGDLLKENPNQRRDAIRGFTGQLYRLGRGMGKLSPEDKKRVVQMLNDRAQPYMREMQRLSPEQQREFKPALDAFKRVMNAATQPPPAPKPGVPPKASPAPAPRPR